MCGYALLLSAQCPLATGQHDSRCSTPLLEELGFAVRLTSCLALPALFPHLAGSATMISISAVNASSWSFRKMLTSPAHSTHKQAGAARLQLAGGCKPAGCVQ